MKLIELLANKDIKKECASKLGERFNSKSYQDLKIEEIGLTEIDLSDEKSLRLSEMFETEVKILNKEQLMKKKTTLVSYTLDLEPKIFVNFEFYPFSGNFVGKVEFSNEETGNKNTNAFGVQTASAIINTVIKLASKYINIKIWFFGAKLDKEFANQEQSLEFKEFLRKQSLYRRIARRIAKEKNLEMETLKIRGDEIIVLSKEGITKDQVMKFYNYQSST